MANECAHCGGTPTQAELDRVAASIAKDNAWVRPPGYDGPPPGACTGETNDEYEREYIPGYNDAHPKHDYWVAGQPYTPGCSR